MVKKCFVFSCSQPASSSCRCAASITYFCNSHLSLHISSGLNHEITSLMTQSSRNFNAEISSKINYLLGCVSRIESDIHLSMSSILNSLQHESERILIKSLEIKQFLLKTLKCIKNSSFLDSGDQKIVENIKLDELRDTGLKLMVIKNIALKFSTLNSLDLLLSFKNNKQLSDFIFKERELCIECKIGYYFNCEVHLLCEVCRLCYCDRCKHATATPMKSISPTMFQLEDKFYSSSMNSKQDIKIMVYGGCFKASNQKISAIKITSKKFQSLSLNLELMHYLNGKCSSFLLVFGYFNTKNSNFIITEHASDTLHDRIDVQFTTKQLLTIIKQLLDGFAFMAFHGIYHQSISLNNILLTPDLQPKIFNFSLAIKLGKNTDASIGRSRSEWAFDEINNYSAPEKKNISRSEGGSKGFFCYNIEKADVFSLGLVILQLTTKFDSSILTDTDFNFLNKEIDKITDHHLKEILKRMLYINPGERLFFKELIDFFKLQGSLIA